MFDLAPLIAAAIVGFLVGLTGVGGGALMTPVLILVLQINPVVAIATDLIFALITKIAAVLVHARSAAIDWQFSKLMWVGSVPGAVIGVATLVVLSSVETDFLTVFLAAVLIVASISMFRGATYSPKNRFGITGIRLASAGMGFAVASTSVGAGTLGMVLLRSQLGDATPRKLVGTDLVHSIPIAAIAGSSYLLFGLVDIALLATMLVASVPSAIFGAVVSGHLPASLLRMIVAAAIATAALALLLKVF